MLYINIPVLFRTSPLLVKLKELHYINKDSVKNLPILAANKSSLTIQMTVVHKYAFNIPADRDFGRICQEWQYWRFLRKSLPEIVPCATSGSRIASCAPSSLNKMERIRKQTRIMSLPYFLQFPRLLGQILTQPGFLISDGIPSLHFSDRIEFCKC